MINTFHFILMLLSSQDVVSSANHATSGTRLNVYESKQACETAMPSFVKATYSQFNPIVTMIDYQVVMLGQASSSNGSKTVTWRCVTVLTPTLK
jgi:hypothetical protein